jgi:hypothetical protein
MNPSIRIASKWTLWSAGVALFAVLGVVSAQSGAATKEATGATAAKAPAAGKYIGVDKCKSCHSNDAAGNQYDHWTKTGHAKAFEVLASDQAKKIATEKGIADPQTSDKCVKCHVTAFGVAADMLKAKPDQLKNVQCEVCHGPGDKHQKARFAEAAKAADSADPTKRQVVPAGEIVVAVDENVCKTCHNPESPTFKPFCFHERSAKIAHLDPRKEHPAKRPPCSCDKCKAGCPDDCGAMVAKK